MRQLAAIFLLILALQAHAQNIGIGTTIPNGKLQINHKGTSTTPALMVLDSSAGTGSEIKFIRQGITTARNFNMNALISGGLNSASLWAFRANSSNVMTINGDGLIYFGAAPPNFFSNFNVGTTSNFGEAIYLNGQLGEVGQPIISNFENGAPLYDANTYFLPTGFAGFGTATPAARLQINHKGTAANPALMILDSTSGAGSEIRFAREGSPVAYNFNMNAVLDPVSSSLSQWKFSGTNNQLAMTINGDGQLSTGVTPLFNALFTVNGSADFEDQIKIKGNAGVPGQPMITQGNGQAPQWYPNAYFMSNGKIGVGTDAPGAKLQINHTNSLASPALLLLDSTSGTGSSIFFQKSGIADVFKVNTILTGTAANNSLTIQHNTGTPAITIKGDNKTGVNQSAPAAALDVNGGLKVRDTMNVISDLNINRALKVNSSAGTSGQVLVSKGPGLAPAWQNMPAVLGSVDPSPMQSGQLPLAAVSLQTREFICSTQVVINAVTDKIFWIATRSVGTNGAGAISLSLYPGYTLSGAAGVPSILGPGLFDLRCSGATRQECSVSGFVTNLAPGTYDIGMVGFSPAVANWNNCDNFGTVTYMIFR